MATSPKMLKLLESLRAATAQGRLQWAESFGSNTFMLEIKDASIFLSSDMSGGDRTYFISLQDKKGRAIDEEFFEPGDDGYEFARDLHEEARRNALHVDDFIDNVINNIG